MINLLTATELADKLRVSRARLYELARRKLIPSVQIGRRQVRFEEEAIRNWIAAGGSNHGGRDLAMEKSI